MQTCAASPSQWDAWTTGGRYLYLRYRHGIGSVESHPSSDPETWDGEESELLAEWNDGSNRGRIELDEFLKAANLQLERGAEVVAQHEDGDEGRR